jgi:hypothetical protein
MSDDEKMQKEISDAITRYYDSLTDEEVAEHRAWGEMGRTRSRRVGRMKMSPHRESAAG